MYVSICNNQSFYPFLICSGLVRTENISIQLKNITWYQLMIHVNEGDYTFSYFINNDIP